MVPLDKKLVTSLQHAGSSKNFYHCSLAFTEERHDGLWFGGLVLCVGTFKGFGLKCSEEEALG